MKPRNEALLCAQILIGILWLTVAIAIFSGVVISCREAIKIPEQGKDWSHVSLTFYCAIPAFALAVVVTLLSEIERHLRPVTHPEPADPAMRVRMASEAGQALPRLSPAEIQRRQFEEDQRRDPSA